MAGKHTLRLTDDELATVKGGVGELRRQVFEGWKAAPLESDERQFYRRRMDEFDALLEKIEGAFIADTSQDAEPDEEDEADPRPSTDGGE